MLLLREQHDAGYPDVAGTQVAATFPFTDRLLTHVVRQRLPATAPVRSLDVRAHAGDRLTVRARLVRPTFLPTFTFPLRIVHQPRMPHDPVLVLRLGSPGGIMKLAGPAMRFFDVLPPGITLHEEHLRVDLRALLDHQQIGFALEFVEHLEVRTAEGQVVVSVRGRIPPPGMTGR